MNTPQYDSSLTRLMLALNQAFEKYSHHVDPLVIERFAGTIHQVMSARFRRFHTLEHIFDATKGLETLPLLAGFFHDVVYYQVDRRIHTLLVPYLGDFSLDEKTNLCVLPDLESERWLTIAGKVFGFKTGQTLNPFNGLNEFLSAVAAARILGNTLTEWEVIQMIACIEATIPFRGNSFEPLKNRLIEIIAGKVNEAEITKAVQAAVSLANQDICGFYNEDFGDFISGTWSLILENNPIFKNPLYTVKEYRQALQKVRGFLSSLKPEVVVQEWGGFPSTGDFQKMKDQVRTNLANALLYLDVNFVVMSLLEGIAEASGGDAPYALFVGEGNKESSKAPIERFLLINQPAPVKTDFNKVVYQTLKTGRKDASSFDFKHSPVAAFIYENLSTEEMTKAIVLAREFHEKKIDLNSLLTHFRPEVLNPIIRGVGEVSWSRKEKLQQLFKV